MKKIFLIILAFVMLLFPSCNSISEYNYKNLIEDDYTISGFSAEDQVIKFHTGYLRNGYFETKDSPVDMLKYTEKVAKEKGNKTTKYYFNLSDANNIEFYGINGLGEEIPDNKGSNWLSSRISERIDYYREPEKILEKAGIQTKVNDVIFFATIGGPIAQEIGIFFECGKTDYVYIMEEHWELIDGKATNYTYPEYVIPHDIYLETIRIFKPWTLSGGVRIDDWQQRYNENFKVEDYKISLVEE